VTDRQRRAAVTGLVTAGSVLLGSALLAAGCASSGPPARSPASQELSAMAARYMAIARPANRELDHEFDAFDDHMKDGDLAAARAELTSTAAGVTSLRELRRYQRRLDAANEPVEDAVRVIRAQLGLPPPGTS